jgi:predicted TIM-barrel fold metal-dependent hydrolase
MGAREEVLAMMTIDVHAHLPCRKNLNPAESAQTIAFAQSMGVSVEEDFPVARLLSEMDRGGVQMAVLQGHPPNAGFFTVNDEIAAIVAQHPDRLLAFAGVDPLEGAKAVQELERCVRELGFKGCGEFGYMDILDERCFPIYEKCVELDVPILIHFGFTLPTAPLKYGDPVPLDEVALRFPDLKIIAAHCAFPWFWQLAVVAARRPNVYVDVSALGMVPEVARLQTILTFLNLGSDRVLFGTDFPFGSPATYTPYVRGLRVNFLLRRLLGVAKVTPRDIERIMGNNARRLLKLDQA